MTLSVLGLVWVLASRCSAGDTHVRRLYNRMLQVYVIFILICVTHIVISVVTTVNYKSILTCQNNNILVEHLLFASIFLSSVIVGGGILYLWLVVVLLTCRLRKPESIFWEYAFMLHACNPFCVLPVNKNSKINFVMLNSNEKMADMKLIGSRL